MWARLALAGGLSIVLLVVLSPPRPGLRGSALGAVAAGVGAGTILFVTVARRRPFVPSLTSNAVAKCSILAVAAANEEVLWRRVALGELLHSGAAAALAGSTLGFALGHRSRTGLHLGTGLVFGGLYLATGALLACIAAHFTYNLCLLALHERARQSAGLVR